jgi:hypothetical protein
MASVNHPPATPCRLLPLKHAVLPVSRGDAPVPSQLAESPKAPQHFYPQPERLPQTGARAEGTGPEAPHMAPDALAAIGNPLFTCGRHTGPCRYIRRPSRRPGESFPDDRTVRRCRASPWPRHYRLRSLGAGVPACAWHPHQKNCDAPGASSRQGSDALHTARPGSASLAARPGNPVPSRCPTRNTGPPCHTPHEVARGPRVSAIRQPTG